MDPFGRTFNRLLAVFGLSLVFVATASIVSPRTSSARPSARPAAPPSGADGQIIGRLAGVDYEVVIRATTAGARYSVLDTSGKPLAENLTIEQLGQKFAGLDGMVNFMMQSKGLDRMGRVDEMDDIPLTVRH